MGSEMCIRDRYVTTEWMEDSQSGFRIKVVTGYKNVDRLKAKLAQHGAVFMKSEDVFSLPEQSFISVTVSYTHLRAHETDSYLVCRLLLEKKKKTKRISSRYFFKNFIISI